MNRPARSRSDRSSGLAPPNLGWVRPPSVTDPAATAVFASTPPWYRRREDIAWVVLLGAVALGLLCSEDFWNSLPF